MIARLAKKIPHSAENKNVPKTARTKMFNRNQFFDDDGGGGIGLFAFALISACLSDLEVEVE